MRMTEAMCAAQMTAAELQEQKERFTHVDAEKLLTIGEVAGILGVSTKTVRRHQAALRAKGLQTIEMGRMRRFSKKSLDRLIVKAGQEEGSLWD